MSWRTKCVELSREIQKKADVLNKETFRILSRASTTYDDTTRFTEDDARDNYRKLASLNDQLDNVIPTVNRIARGSYGLLRSRDVQS